MGNCASCCGKADSNEIITEKQAKPKGVGKEVDLMGSGAHGSNKPK